METILKKDKGITLIELLVALVISGLLIAAAYRIFNGQQKTKVVQEQVVDMQQNVRAAINRMMTEIRMANFGGNVSDVLPLNGFTQVITMNPTDITIVGAFMQVKDANGIPITVILNNGNQIILSAATGHFDGPVNGYISIGGLGSYKVNQPTGITNVLTLDLTPTYAVGSYIFKIQAITYVCGKTDQDKPVLLRYENTYPTPIQPIVPRDDPNILGDNIENIKFLYQYLDKDENLITTTDPSDVQKVQMINVTAKATTDMYDPNLKGGDGYRRRQIASNIHLKNMGITP
jgi:prepilin-type N-terminal cleavage/methylation domain-containing protein